MSLFPFQKTKVSNFTDAGEGLHAFATFNEDYSNFGAKDEPRNFFENSREIFAKDS